MRITYDPSKREATLLERGLDFENAAEVFAGSVLTVLNTWQDHGEDRYVTIGSLRGERVMVVWTPRGEDRHVISMRRCRNGEIRRYEALGR